MELRHVQPALPCFDLRNRAAVLPEASRGNSTITPEGALQAEPLTIVQLVVQAVESDWTGPFAGADPVGNSNFDVNGKLAAGCVDCGDLALSCWLALIGRTCSHAIKSCRAQQPTSFESVCGIDPFVPVLRR